MTLPEKNAINSISSSDFLKTVDRITFIQKMHHQRKGKDAFSIELSGWYICEVSEQSYQRDTVITKEKVPLDLGWLKDKPCTIVIQNVTGKNYPVNRSEEEKQELNQTNLRVLVGTCLDPAEFTIRPGKIPFIGETKSSTQIILCAENGDVDVTITVLPR